MKFVIVILTLLAVTVAADTSWELDGADCGSMPTSYLDAGVGFVLSPDTPNSTTHYIAGLDTMLVDREIECDTVWQKYQTDSLSGYIVKAIVCDTTLRFKTQPIWKPLIAVKLTPEQIAKLMEILKPKQKEQKGWRIITYDGLRELKQEELDSLRGEE